MDLLTLIILILLVMWLLGYFGRGRWYRRGPTVTPVTLGGDWLWWLIIIAVVIVLLRLLGAV